MHRFFFIILISFLPLFSTAQNLVKNPSFENGSSSWVIKTAKIVHDIKRSGKSSLMYINTDPKNYQVIIAHIPVEGGESIDFSAWLKGRDIKPKNAYAKKGAGIYVHAYDANNQSLGGSNPPTLAGDFEWTQVKGRFQVPENAVKLAVSLYLVQGNTGTVWFDDIHVQRTAAAQAQTTAARSSSVRGEVYIDDDGFTVKSGRRIFPFGIYLGKGTKQGAWASSDQNLQRIKNAGFNTVLSYYYGDRPDAEKYLDQAAKIGLNVIYNLADMYEGHANYTNKNMRPLEKIQDLVERLKDKPALMSWYTADEITESHVIAAEQNYQLIKELDTDHLIYQVNDKPRMLRSLLSSADVIGTDPYPIGSNRPANLKSVRDWTSQAVSSAGKSKGVWQAVQIFNKGAYQSSNKSSYVDPSEKQIRNMLFQSVIAGAKGIMFYSFHDLWHGVGASGKAVFSEKDFQRRWEAVEAVSKEFNKIIPIILNNQLVKVDGLKADKDIITKAWKYQGKTYVMAVNTSKENRTLKIGGQVDITLEGDGAQFFSVEDGRPLSAEASPKALISPLQSFPYFIGSYQWILAVFGYRPSPLDRAIQNYLAA